MRRTVLSLGFAFLALTGCSIFDSLEEACNLVGCTSGLTVRLESLPAGAVRIDVYGQSPDLQPSYTYDCSAAGPCDQQVFFPGMILDHGYVRVTTSAGSRLTEIHPTYQSNRPNGPDCPPECRHASVTVPT